MVKNENYYLDPKTGLEKKRMGRGKKAVLITLTTIGVGAGIYFACPNGIESLVSSYKSACWECEKEVSKQTYTKSPSKNKTEEKLNYAHVKPKPVNYTTSLKPKKIVKKTKKVKKKTKKIVKKIAKKTKIAKNVIVIQKKTTIDDKITNVIFTKPANAKDTIDYSNPSNLEKTTTNYQNIPSKLGKYSNGGFYRGSHINHKSPNMRRGFSRPGYRK